MRSYLIAFICCIVLLVVTTPIIGVLLIDYQLNNKSIEWRKKTWNFEGIHYQDITHPKMSAQHMYFYFDWPPHIHFTDVHLLTLPSQSQDMESSNSSFVPLKVTIENAYLPSNPILEEAISGELTPILSLKSESLQIDRFEGSLRIELQKYIEYNDFFTIKGDMLIELTNNNINIEGLRLEHPLLDRSLGMGFFGKLSQSKLTGSIYIGDLEVQSTIPFSLENKSLSGQFQGKLELKDILKSLKIPEAKRIDVTGGISVKGTIYGPPLHFSMSIEDIDFASTSGNLINPNELLFGSYPHKPLNSDEIRITGPRSGTWVSFKDMGWMPKAVVAGEDSQFYNHKGYDEEQLEIAIREVLAKKENARGGSTITQQLAKNLFLSSERSFERKLKELLYTLELERRLEKDEILEIYLNIVEFGPGIYGIKEAADVYFVKTPQRLNLKESAFLASILPAPRFFYSAYKENRTPQTWRIDQVLQNLKDAELISLSQLRQAETTPLNIVPLP